MLAAQAQGCNVQTIEGLAPGASETRALHPEQKEF